MSAPRWACLLLARLAPPGRVEDVLGDLEEGHRRRRRRHGRFVAALLTGVEALELAWALHRGPGARRYAPSFSWLDVKLGLRMLARYPGLTVVGGLAMAFAIWVGAALFELTNQVVNPRLPLDEGDRIVELRTRDLGADRGILRTRGVRSPTLHDFLAWREDLRAVEDLGAYTARKRNLVTGDGRGQPIAVAEISASAFRVARVPPLLGRVLVDGDEAPGAEAVVVLGHGVWQRSFAGAPDIVGRTIRLGRDEHTVVGVMPEGFRFPVAHEVWTPLRLNPLDYERATSPRLAVFGRLRPGVTLEQAQAELTTLGLRAAADFPETHGSSRPEVSTYAGTDLSGLVSVSVFSTVTLFVVLLVVLLCGNVALLMFAKAATREAEIVVRTALGATRGRIVGQLFAEALVLGALAAALGLGAAGYGLRLAFSVVQAEVLDGSPLPFWFHDSLSVTTVVYATGIAVLCAVVAGVLPALKITGPGALARLRRAGVGGGTPTLGRFWSVVMVLQIAATIVFSAVAWEVRAEARRELGVESGFSGGEHLTARVEMDPEAPPGATSEPPESFEGRYRQAVLELKERLLADPSVAGVTFAEGLPRLYHPWRQVEVEDGMAPTRDERGHRLGSARVAPDYFEVLGIPLLEGRPFASGDVGSDHPVVLVNQSFVDRVLGGQNPLGRRVRVVASEENRDPDQEPGPWYEIIGVVGDVAEMSGYGRTGMYHPIAPGDAYPTYVAVRVRGDPAAFAPTLSRLVVDVDPTLRLSRMLPLDRVNEGDVLFYRFWFWLSAAVSAIALLLSLSGICAVFAFVVSRRTREIGIRVALGSDRRRVVFAIFRRPMTEVGVGILLGIAVVWGILSAGQGISAGRTAAIAGYAVLMTAVCALACIVPTRRALAIQPTDALRADG